MTIVSSDLLTELGFIEAPTYWVDNHGHIFYKNRLPQTLGELVKIMTGVAFKKGESKAHRLQAQKDEAIIRNCSGYAAALQQTPAHSPAPATDAFPAYAYQ